MATTGGQHGAGPTERVARRATKATPVPTSREERRQQELRQRRTERIQLGERQRRRRQLLRLAVAAAALVVLAGIGYVAYDRSQGGDTAAVVGQVKSYGGDNVARGHQEGRLTYKVTPPVGGVHNTVWQNCGAYDQPIANEHGVHSLEHGAVWITYRPGLPADQVATLKALTNQTYVLVSPYPDLPFPVVASAWGKQLPLNTPDPAALADFIAKYRQGPQTPELGAACTGGTSATGPITP